MTLTRKKSIIIAVLVVAVIAAIIATVFACGSSDKSGGSGDIDNKYSCIVTFDMNGGRITDYTSYRVEVEKDTLVKRPSDIPYREGYVFWGWNTTGNESDPMWKFDVEKITQDMTIYAAWVKECTVEFNAEGGTFDDGGDTLIITAVYGTKITAPKVTPPDETMEIESWVTVSGEQWDFSHDTVPYNSLGLYAKWDLKRDIKRALAPFVYSQTRNGYRIDGVKDKDVSGTLTVPSVVTSIEYAAFANCPNIVSVIISDSVTEMGRNVFQNCEKLKSVILPSGLTSIEQYTFDGCSSLEQIQLPDSVTEVGGYAFRGCTALKSIEIPNGVSEVKSSTFDGCAGLENILLPNTVTKIGEDACRGCTSLKSIQIPSGVNEILYSTFENCTSLKQVKLGNNVTQIGQSAFRGCSALVDFQIPSAVEKLGYYAFDGCSSLRAITIPASCNQIGEYVFQGCTNLTTVELHCATVDGDLFDDCTALTDVIIGDEVLTLESRAFSGCSSIRNVTIGDGIKEIPQTAFSHCYNLRNLTIGGGVKEIKYQAFTFCHSLLSITIPSNVQSIGSNAFLGCQKLVEVYNLSGASLDGTSVNTNAVVHTDGDEESIIHTTADGFSFCIFKDEDVYPYAQTPFLVDYSGDGENIVLPDSYNGENYKIYKYALSHNPKIKSVRFSAGVMDIKDDILYASDNVTSLTVDGNNEWLSSSGNCVINTADKEFVLGCKTSVIPTDGSVTTIGSNVFCENTTISSEALKIPDTVTRVRHNAFTGCSGIMRTVEHVVYVDNWAIALGDFDLNSDEKLDLEFQSGTIGIADNAFWYKNCIRSVTFNDEMKYVGYDAFFKCNELTDVNFNDGLLIIYGSAFYECIKLQAAVLPDSVTTLGWGAFIYCYALTYVKLPARLERDNTQIFYNCNALNAVVIPQSIEKIGYSVFSGCPDTVKVYYEGSEQQWKAIEIKSSNTAIVNATKYFYSETEIEGVNCWHYGADGRPTTEY